MLVLAEGGPAAADVRVQAHERAVNRLLEGIQGQEFERRLNGGFGRSRLPLVTEELRQAFQGELA